MHDLPKSQLSLNVFDYVGNEITFNEFSDVSSICIKYFTNCESWLWPKTSNSNIDTTAEMNIYNFLDTMKLYSDIINTSKKVCKIDYVSISN